MRSLRKVVVGGIVAALLCLTSAEAATIIISTSNNQLQPGVDNQGWVSATNPNGNPNNDNYFTGASGGPELRSYFFFDVSGITDTIVSARLDVRRYDSSPGTIEFFDVSTPAASLIATRGAAANPGIAADLGSGTSYGSFAIGAGGTLDILSFILNASAVADVNAASGYFAIGGRATAGGPFFTFSNNEPGVSGGATNFTQQLVIETSPAAVPEPTTLVLFGSGLAAAAMRRRRARK